MTALDGLVLTYMYVIMLYFLLFGDIFDSNQSQLILFLETISSQHINVPHPSHIVRHRLNRMADLLDQLTQPPPETGAVVRNRHHQCTKTLIDITQEQDSRR
jgi:hypothetical protein